MRSDGTSHVQLAQRLINGGRFSEVVATLQRSSLFSSASTKVAQLHQCLLADALQRTGRNNEAESLTTQNLTLLTNSPPLAARCHFVLGNVFRERGDTRTALGHFHTAERLAAEDLELSCWIQLRLMAAVADLGGIQSAMARLGEVKRTLTRLGDARPFAALHLWIAEAESIQGNLESARRHLRIAESLLAQVDDVWLRGYLAINSFGVSYHCAEISEARRWAELAIECSETSGHCGARRAAHANMGHIEFSQGNVAKAQECFELALKYCEPGSTNHIAVLDSIAQLRLYSGDLAGCRSILDNLDNIAGSDEHSKPSHYRAWALQTKIQLLLKENKIVEARNLCREIMGISATIPRSRVSAVLQLVAIETLLADGEFAPVAQHLALLLSTNVDLPPDLFAETERIIAKVLRLSGECELAEAHLARSIETFDVIGHSFGKKTASEDAKYFSRDSAESGPTVAPVGSLDRIRALIDTRRRPELFGREAMALLRDLNCAESVTLSSHSEFEVLILKHVGANSSQPGANGIFSVDLGKTGQKRIVLSFVPKSDPSSIVAALTFQRVVERLLPIQTADSEFMDCEPLWSANEYLSSQEVVFSSEAMLEILGTIRKISSTNLSVLITGETGTGKEVLAKAIHQHSGRASKPFIALNCTTVPRDLLESQLFGHRRGAFSGASEPFQGVIRAANGGTLLLDEIGEMPVEMQPKLLRFLESGEIHPLGESHPTIVDVRLLFATNANLADAVKQGRFREDLFFRINVIPIAIPPLRERREEIPLLVNLFAQRFSRELSREPVKFATDTMESLIFYSWPGNVRQLGNEVRRLVAMSDDGAVIRPQQLSREITKSNSSFQTPVRSSQGPEPIVLERDQPLAQAVAHLERSMIAYALQKTSGQVASAAQILGLSRKGLYLKRQRLGILDFSRNSTQ